MFDEVIFELTKALQDAALDAARWEPALNLVNSFVGGSGAVLLSVEARLKYAPSSSDLTDMMGDYFNLGWHARDRRDKCVPILQNKGIVFDSDFQTIEEIENCDFYHDLLAKHGRKWFAGVGAEVDGDYWCLALQRSPERDPFSASDLSRLQVLRCALVNTANLSKRIGHTWISGMQHALDVVGRPAIVFDKNAQVLEYNDGAAPIVRAFVGKDRRICFASTSSAAALHKIVSSALQPLEARPPSALRGILPFGNASYDCRAVSLLGHKGLIACNAAVLLIMERTLRNTESSVSAKYVLTRAEYKVATALSSGKSVKDIADEGKVKADTIRTQLKSIYQKMDVNKQSQLVALIRTLGEGW